MPSVITATRVKVRKDLTADALVGLQLAFPACMKTPIIVQDNQPMVASHTNNGRESPLGHLTRSSLLLRAYDLKSTPSLKEKLHRASSSAPNRFGAERRCSNFINSA